MKKNTNCEIIFDLKKKLTFSRRPRARAHTCLWYLKFYIIYGASQTLLPRFFPF
jgi:hypothetical protein